MKSSLVGLNVLCVLLSAFLAETHAALLVHYTFDDITGSTVVDSAGTPNNATLFNNVGIGIPGVIGNAIRLPNDDGTSYARLPASQNPAPVSNNPRTIAFFFSQELVGVENKMFGYGSGGTGQSFDVSLEGGGIRLRYSGGNVTWGNGYDFTGADAGFHHLAIRVPNGAFDYLDVEVLLDGDPLVGVPTGGNPGGTFINTGGGSATNLDIGRSPVFAPSGDFIGLIDDFRIYDTALTDAQIRNLIPAIQSLTLEVDLLTGQGAIRNLTEAAVELDYYEISSTQAAIQSTGWKSLETQNRVNFPAGDGLGAGWEVLGTPNTNLLAEGRLLGLSSLEPGAWIDLGTIYNPAAPQQLALTYGVGGAYQTVQAEFFTPNATADFDRDGDVDSEDLVRWQLAYGVDGSADANGDGLSDGRDFLDWQRQFTGASPVVAEFQSIPEPATGVLIFGCMMTCWRPGRRAFGI